LAGSCCWQLHLRNWAPAVVSSHLLSCCTTCHTICITDLLRIDIIRLQLLIPFICLHEQQSQMHAYPPAKPSARPRCQRSLCCAPITSARCYTKPVLCCCAHTMLSQSVAAQHTRATHERHKLRNSGTSQAANDSLHLLYCVQVVGGCHACNVNIGGGHLQQQHTHRMCQPHHT
jgi:hypothetical protein